MNVENSDISRFIRSLLSAIVNTSLYSASHPQVTHLSEAAVSSIETVLADLKELTLVVIDNELVINGEQQYSRLTHNRLAQIMKESGIGHLKITEGLAGEEVAALISTLSSRGAGPLDALKSCPHIRFGQVEVRLDSKEENAETRDTLQLPEMQTEELSRFLDLYETVKRQKQLKLNGMMELVSRVIHALQQESSSFLVLATLRAGDEYTFTHSTNVCILNLAQAMALGIEGQKLHDIGIAAILHDIGKLFIPEEILNKKGKLTSEEFAIMKEHPSRGARYLLDTPGAPHLAIVAAHEHHMKYNCTGYPSPPPGWQPNLCSHMTMISDFFDALRTKRPYRPPMETGDIAILLMDLSGVDFHPILTRNFLIILQRLMAAEESADV